MGLTHCSGNYATDSQSRKLGTPTSFFPLKAGTRFLKSTEWILNFRTHPGGGSDNWLTSGVGDRTGEAPDHPKNPDCNSRPFPVRAKKMGESTGEGTLSLSAEPYVSGRQDLLR